MTSENHHIYKVNFITKFNITPDKFVHFLFTFTILFWFISINQSELNFLKQLANTTFYIQPLLSLKLGKEIQNLPEIIYKSIAIIVVPSGIYYFLNRLFSLHIGKCWSAILAFMSISVFDDFSIHQFVIAIIKGVGYNSSYASSSPAVFQIPIPGFSTLYFVAAVFFMIKTKSLSQYHILIASAVLACSFYINAIDSLFLLVFWFVYMIAKGTRKLKWSPLFTTKYLIISLMVLVFLAFPALWNSDFVNIVNKNSNGSYVTFILALVGPVFLMTMFYLSQRIDPMELVARFGYVFALLFAELFLVVLASTKILGLDLNILAARIPQYFLHWLYYVPPIYYLSRSVPDYKFGIESKGLFKRFRQGVQYVSSNEKFIIAAVAIIVAVYNVLPILI